MFQLYGWLQLLIVGVPVLFLISDYNTTARYFLFVYVDAIDHICPPVHPNKEGSGATESPSCVASNGFTTDWLTDKSRRWFKHLIKFNSLSKVFDSIFRSRKQGSNEQGQDESSNSGVVAALPV